MAQGSCKNSVTMHDTNICIINKIIDVDRCFLFQRYAIQCELEKGTYKVVPFSTGCRLKERESDPSVETKLVRKKGDRYVLTNQFK